MAECKVYYKWSGQDGGGRGKGAWTLAGEGAATQQNHGINALSNHAERAAWREAWPHLLKNVPDIRKNFKGQHLQVKFWVDQQICPTCQKWLIIDVISNLKFLSTKAEGLEDVELIAEVRFQQKDRAIQVKRTTIWPIEIGNREYYDQLPAIYT